MNGLKIIRNSSKLAKELEPHLIVYFFLLTRVFSVEEKLMSDYSPVGVERELKQFNVASALDELIKLGYIQVDNEDNIYVGEIVKDEPVLFSNVSENSDISDIISELWDLWKSYNSECKIGGKVSPANSCKVILTNLENNKVDNWSRSDMRNFFRLVYELWHQEKYREFIVKDNAQFKKLDQIYEQAVLARMIYYFMRHYPELGKKTLPDIGNLLFHKDTVFNKVTTKRITKREYKSTSKHRFK